MHSTLMQRSSTLPQPLHRYAAPPPPPRAAAAAAAAAARGPMGPSPARNKPDWVRILEEDAAVDEEVAELLRGTDGDPDKIRAKMEEKLRSPFGSSGGPSSSGSTTTGSSSLNSSSSAGPAELPFEARTGSDTPPHITFKEVDVFDLWVWLEFVVPPAQREKELLQSTLKSWFVVGKLGGFNCQNLQVYYNNSDDNSFLDYDSQEAGSALSAFMHSCSDAEFKGSWARFHVDLGTADELAFDVLINMLVGFSFEVAGISRIMIGGEHERWEVPPRVTAEEELGWDADEANGRPKREHGQAPKVGINPMKLPQGVEEELEMLDELGSWYNSQEPQQQQQPPQQPKQQPAQARQWGKGLRSLGVAATLPRQQQQQQSPQQQQQQQSAQQQQPRQQQPVPQQGGGVTGNVAAASRRATGSTSTSRSERARAQLERLRKLQQMEQGGGLSGSSGGMTMYSEDEFKKAFNVADDDDGQKEL